MIRHLCADILTCHHPSFNGKTCVETTTRSTMRSVKNLNISLSDKLCGSDGRGPLITDITPVWDFPQLVPTAPDMAEDYKRQKWENSGGKNLLSSTISLLFFFFFILGEFCLKYKAFRICTLTYCQLTSSRGGRAVRGVCLTRSECLGHGQLLTYGIL